MAKIPDIARIETPAKSPGSAPTLAARVLRRLRGQARLSMAVAALSLPVLAWDLGYSPESGGPLEAVHLAGALAYFAVPLLLVPWLTLPLCLSKWTRPLPALIHWAWLALLGVDFFVFRAYFHHLDFEVVGVVVMDMGGLGAPKSLWIVAGLMAALLLAIVVGALVLLEGRRGGAPLRLQAACLGLSLLALAAGSCVNIWAAANSREEILRHNSYLPFFQPVTSSRWAPRLSGFMPGLFPPELGAAPPSGGLVNYPLEPLRFAFDDEAALAPDPPDPPEPGCARPPAAGGEAAPAADGEAAPEASGEAAPAGAAPESEAGPAGPDCGADPETAASGVVPTAAAAAAVAGPALPRRPSILILVFESWQSAAMTPEITPNLWELSNHATRFERHISSGSSTVPGVFGLMYGVHPTLYRHLRNVPLSHPSLLTESLHERGWSESVFTGSRLDRFQLQVLLFPRVPPERFHQGPDAELVDLYLRSLDGAGEGPRLDFMFLVASHTPYAHPPEAAKFLPLPAVEGAYLLDPGADPAPYYNAYRNSLHYLDILAGRLIEGLKSRGLYDGMWIVVTGDHAEEFNENGLGYWGHGGNFSRWQTAVPMIVKRPGQTAGRIESRTSIHQDLAPTLLGEILGCRTEPAAWSDGTSLYALPPGPRATIVGSYFDIAYIRGDLVLERLRMRRYCWTDMAPLEPDPDERSWLEDLRWRERRFIARRDLAPRHHD